MRFADSPFGIPLCLRPAVDLNRYVFRPPTATSELMPKASTKFLNLNGLAVVEVDEAALIGLLLVVDEARNPHDPTRILHAVVDIEHLCELFLQMREALQRDAVDQSEGMPATR